MPARIRYHQASPGAHVKTPGRRYTRMTSPLNSGGYAPPKLRVYSVIAGVNRYENNGQLPDLASAERDAWRVSQHVKLGNAVMEPDPTSARTTVLLGKQVTSSAIRDALRKLFNRAELSERDIIFFYFAGHGVVDDSDGYLCCYNYTTSNPSADSIRFTELYHDAQGLYSTANVIVALDSCFSGAIVSPNQIGGNPVQQVRNILRSHMTGSGARAIYAAAQPHQRAREDASVDYDENTKESGGGFFTSAFIHGWFLGEGCDPRNGRLSLNTLASFIQQKVADRQSSSFGADRIQEPIATINGPEVIINVVDPRPNSSTLDSQPSQRQIAFGAPDHQIIMPMPPTPPERPASEKTPWGRIALFGGVALILVTACSVGTLVSTPVFDVWLGVAVLMAVLSVPLARNFGLLTGLLALVQLVLLVGLAHARLGWLHGVGGLDGVAHLGWLATVIFILQTLFDVGIGTFFVLNTLWSN